MELIDLSLLYLQDVIGKNDPRHYEAALPQLFEHYYAYYAPPQPYSFRNEEEILHRRQQALQRIPRLSQKFEQNGLAVEGVQLVLFVGHGTSNGHAFPLGDQWVVWLPLEAYPTAFAMDVFFTHEIAHALHYQRQPAFYFKDEVERTQIFRQLVTEGIATLASKEILRIGGEQALWADYLPPENVQQWYQQCQQRERELFRTVSEKLHTSDPQNRLFSYSDSAEVDENRAVYYLGLRLIEHYVETEGLHLRDILEVGKTEFLRIVRGFLAREEYRFSL
ncbi:MAG: DUF2268 domain-containing putative Zn-dependent protease [Anaerolineales bacterium]